MKSALVVLGSTVALAACMSSVSHDYVQFQPRPALSAQKILPSGAGPLVDSVMPNSRVAVGVVSPKSLIGYGTPLAIVVVNRGKSTVKVSEADISAQQKSGLPSIVSPELAESLDREYTSSHFNTGMVMALLGGALLAVARTTDSASVDKVAKPITKDLDDARALSQARYSAFIKRRFGEQTIQPGKVGTGYVVLKSVKSEPLDINIKVGGEVHHFTLVAGS